jgi:FAD/FMN-containing dehydrogenase
MVSVLSQGSGALRPVGSGHSFSGLVPSDGTLVASDLLSGVISTDAERLQAEVWAGTRLHQLGPLLEARDQALPNLPDMAYPTLGGALATSTHGTGPRFGSLSTFVDRLVLATPSGELLECSPERNAEVFHAARCSLGALGVLTRVRLQNQRAFRLVETAQFEALDGLLEDVERRRDAHRHFELYAFPHASLAQSSRGTA